jgi:signal transduction histidine kinase
MISLVVTSILVPSVIALNTFTKSLETEITEGLKINALNAMDKLSRLMFERIADIRFLTSPANIVMNDGAGGGNSSPEKNNNNNNNNNNFTISQKVEYLRQMEKAYKAYASISLYNNHGIKIGDTRSIAIGVNDSDKAFYKDAINGRIYYDKVPVFSTSLRQYIIDFSGPLYDENNKISGVLVLRFPLNKINDIMLEAGGTISKDADIDLLSKDGLIIYSSNDPKDVLQKKVIGLAIFYKLRNSTNNIEAQIADSAAAAADAQINNSNTTATTGGNTIFIGAKQPEFLDYKGNDWFLILAVNKEDAFRSVTLLRNEFIIVAVVILSISIALVFIFARSISKPIARLRDVTNEVSKGNFDIKVDVQKGGDDELAQLSSSFENMRKTILARTKEVLKANEVLRQKDRLKDEFINVAAHELRTPIQPILSLCYVLGNRIKKGNETGTAAAASSRQRQEEEQLLDIIVRNVKRLHRLAEDILDVTRIEGKDLTLNLQRFDLIAILSDIVRDSRQQIHQGGRNLKLIFENEEISGSSSSSNNNSNTNNKIFVTADRNRINQVICNLLTNAIKFTEQGTISVKVVVVEDSNEHNKKEALVSIKDTGIGIHSDILPQLFTKFTSKSFQGIGLGLFISRKIIEAHGGRIWAENNPDGIGATFYFTLPLSLSPPPQSS